MKQNCHGTTYEGKLIVGSSSIRGLSDHSSRSAMFQFFASQRLIEKAGEELDRWSEREGMIGKPELSGYINNHNMSIMNLLLIPTRISVCFLFRRIPLTFIKILFIFP